MDYGATGAGLGGAFFAIIGVWSLVGLALYVWYLWSLSRLFPWLGLPGVWGWIPVWNQWQLIQRAGLPGWIAVLGLVPGLSIVVLVVSIIAIHRLNTEFGKTAGFTVLGALVPPVWAMLLANHISDQSYAEGAHWPAGSPMAAATQSGTGGFAGTDGGLGAAGGLGSGGYGGSWAGSQPTSGQPAAWQGLPPVPDLNGQGPSTGTPAYRLPQVQSQPSLQQPNFTPPAPGAARDFGGTNAFSGADRPTSDGAMHPAPASNPWAQVQAPVPTQSFSPAGGMSGNGAGDAHGLTETAAVVPPTGQFPIAGVAGAGVAGASASGGSHAASPEVQAPAADPRVAESGSPESHAAAPRAAAPRAAAPSNGSWGFSNTTEGEFERLASEPNPGGSASRFGPEEPQRPYSWPESNTATGPGADMFPDPKTPGVVRSAGDSAAGAGAGDGAGSAAAESHADTAEQAASAEPSIFDAPESAALQVSAPSVSASPAHAPSAPEQSASAPQVPAPAPVAAPAPDSAGSSSAAAQPAGAAAAAADDDDDDDRTIVVSRRTRWGLELPDGELVELTGDDMIVGRKPTAVLGATVLQIPDPTRTMSKSHVRMRRTGDSWTLEDLNSTNGVAVVNAAGEVVELVAGAETPATDQLVIGTLEVRLRRID